ncbi:hypothetical protein B0H11DRAFT_1938771 [Mycena galericulata]|nr:hypothetical protein B0H11DRAFT_1938771 [Mycena galericulata]
MSNVFLDKLFHAVPKMQTKLAEISSVEFLKAMIYERSTIVLVAKFVPDVLEEFYAVPKAVFEFKWTFRIIIFLDWHRTQRLLGFFRSLSPSKHHDLPLARLRRGAQVVDRCRSEGEETRVKKIDDSSAFRGLSAADPRSADSVEMAPNRGTPSGFEVYLLWILVRVNPLQSHSASGTYVLNFSVLGAVHRVEFLVRNTKCLYSNEVRCKSLSARLRYIEVFQLAEKAQDFRGEHSEILD